MFGQDKAFLPMTLDGALKDDHISLGVGFARLVVPAKDPAGRSIIFADPSKLDSTKYDRESMVRATWYVMHAALESVDAQKMGVVMVAYPKHVHITQVDRKLMKLNMESIKGCIPVRLAAFQICHPPEIFSIIFPLIKLFLGEVRSLFSLCFLSRLLRYCVYAPMLLLTHAATVSQPVLMSCFIDNLYRLFLYSV